MFFFTFWFPLFYLTFCVFVLSMKACGAWDIRWRTAFLPITLPIIIGIVVFLMYAIPGVLFILFVNAL